MAEQEDNPSGKVVEEAPSGTPPASQTPDGSSKPTLSAEEEARRQEQSERDKSQASGKDTQDERLSYLEEREMERARDQHVSEFLTSNAEKFPNVKADDPLFKFAASKGDVEQIATELQNRFATMQQDALQSVQVESDFKPLTDEEIAKAEQEFEKTQEKTGKSQFGNFIDTVSRRKR